MFQKRKEQIAKAYNHFVANQSKTRLNQLPQAELDKKNSLISMIKPYDDSQTKVVPEVLMTSDNYESFFELAQRQRL